MMSPTQFDESGFLTGWAVDSDTPELFDMENTSFSTYQNYVNI
jgi:hypothetical protein